ncbi:MAG TPA: DUF1501 domain-containing protein, partial [Verrucomicrobiota bacterium]|nr:DUF1501 domain-containing protein [Verrucomicrobiota bacterium]
MAILLSRRGFIRNTGFALGGLTCWGLAPHPFSRLLMAAPTAQDKKLLFIFQTGGNDGINTVIPRGDADYNTTTRPTLFIPENQALDTGNGFAQLHPRLQPMMEIYNHSRLNGQDGPGNLAVLHRVGYAGQSQSHFDSQQYWQNGVPGNAKLEEGLFYRHLDKTLDLSSQANSFVAAALSSSQMVALKGANPVPNFSRAGDFNAVGTPARAGKFLGQPPSRPGASDGEGLLGLYGGQAEAPGRPYRAAVHDTGRMLGNTITTLQNAISLGAYAPDNNATYPTGSFGDKLREAALLFKRTPVRILGLNLGGWDTHTNQGQINGGHGNLLNNLALGFQALYRDLQAQWNNLLIVTMTEFGRTSRENGSGGTDHADSSVLFIAGGAVKGGSFVGAAPLPANNGPDDVGRGRLLPSVSVEQYAATLGRWFG